MAEKKTHKITNLKDLTQQLWQKYCRAEHRVVFIRMGHDGKARTGLRPQFLWVTIALMMGLSQQSLAQWEDGPLNVIILPFEGKGTGDLTASEAMELELEMVSEVRLVSSRGARVQLAKLSPARRFSPDELSRLMRDFNIDILIRGERFETKEEGPQLKIVAYAKDGMPRWIHMLPLPSDPVRAASELGRSFIEIIADWRDLPVVTDKRVYRLSPMPSDDQEDDTASDTEERDTKISPKNSNEDWEDVSLPKIEPKKSKRRGRTQRSRLGQEVPEANDKTRSMVQRRSSWGLAVGLGFWQYEISGPSASFVNSVGATAYPNINLSFESWFSPYVGLDVSAGVGTLDFEFNADSGLAISPERFSSLQAAGAAALQIRLWASEGTYPSMFSLRLGYLFSMASTDQQSVNGMMTTLVPGWSLHAPIVGLAIRLGAHENGFSWLFKGDIVPWGVYQETPDNPGAQVTPWGWHVDTGLRYQTSTSFYVDGMLQSYGINAQFEGVGDRRSAEGGPWQDAAVQNWTGQLLLRLGTTF